MEPRLKDSNKWTQFPSELVDQVLGVLSESFPQVKGQFHLEGRIYPGEILMRVGIKYEGQLKNDNFEISLGYNAKKQNVLGLLHVCIDTAGSLINELLNNVETDFPLSWQDYEVDGHTLYVQYSSANPDIESQADKFLAEKDPNFNVSEEGLVEGDVDEEELEAKIHMLGLEEDDDKKH